MENPLLNLVIVATLALNYECMCLCFEMENNLNTWIHLRDNLLDKPMGQVIVKFHDFTSRCRNKLDSFFEFLNETHFCDFKRHSQSN